MIRVDDVKVENLAIAAQTSMDRYDNGVAFKNQVNK